MHYHRMNILVRLILYRMEKQRNFENAEMLSRISDHMQNSHAKFLVSELYLVTVDSSGFYTLIIK